MQTDSEKFAFRFCSPQGRRLESYLPESRLYKEYGQKLEYKCLIHVNFDHAWAGHYPITLILIAIQVEIAVFNTCENFRPYLL